MTESYYNGSDHVFYSDNNNTTTIKSGSGQKLNVQGNLVGDSPVINGTNSIDFQINGTSTMKLESDKLTVPRLVSSYGAFTYSNFINNQTQTFAGSTTTLVLYNTQVVNDVGLAITLITLSGATSAGTRFINQTTNDMVLSVSFTVNISTTAGANLALGVQDSPNSFGQQTMTNQAANYNINSSAIIVLPAGKYCEARLFALANTSSSGLPNQTIQFFRLA